MTSLDGIDSRSIQTLLRGENDSKQTDEFQANVVCDLLQNRRAATWNLFVNKKNESSGTEVGILGTQENSPYLELVAYGNVKIQSLYVS